MNIHDPEIETEIRSEGDPAPTEQEARDALAVLRRWASETMRLLLRIWHRLMQRALWRAA